MMVAIYPIVKESFQIYYKIMEILGILTDRFMELEISDSIKVYDIFCHVSKQFDDLDNFYGWCKNVGISHSSGYPEVEKITQKKLNLMDDFIRNKSALAQTTKAITYEAKLDNEEESEGPDDKEVDMNATKALPPPDDFVEDSTQEVIEELIKEEIKEEKIEKEADLLNLGDDAQSLESHANQLALALFDVDGGVATNTSTLELFSDVTADWESALIQSASALSNKRKNLAGGFDMMLLDGMYQQGVTNAAMSNTASGSASSVALGSAGRPGTLALPAPPMANNSNVNLPIVDPFAASSTVAPPPYVQISDMEKKQKLLMDEQLMWEQYAKDGMRGQLELAQPNSYNMGGYTNGH